MLAISCKLAVIYVCIFMLAYLLTCQHIHASWPEETFGFHPPLPAYLSHVIIYACSYPNQINAGQADVKSRLQSNAETIAHLKKCHGEVIDSYEECKKENAALQTQLSDINARAQTEHRNLEEARSKLEDALYVNAHLREENEMITTDDERWAFQVEQREEQLESLTELLHKLEGQQAEIDRRKEKEEAEMVRRLEERRAEMIMRTRSSFGSGGSGGQVTPVLPKDSNTEMSSMMALAPEWTPASAAGGRGGGSNTAPSPATSLSEAVAIEPNAITAPAFAVEQDGGVGHVSVGQDDAISVLTEE